MRPSFKKNKIQDFVGQSLPTDNVRFTLSEDEIINVLEPYINHQNFLDFDDDISSNIDADVDEEQEAYNKYFQNRTKMKATPENQATKEVIKYSISNGVEILVDKKLNLSKNDILKIINQSFGR